MTLIFDLLPDIVNFPLLGAGYFCIPINILDFPVGVQLRYWRHFDPLVLASVLC